MPEGRWMSWTREEVLLIFWPPLPEPRIKVSVMSSVRMPKALSFWIKSSFFIGKSVVGVVCSQVFVNKRFFSPTSGRS